MASLGEFGAAVRELGVDTRERDTFVFFGEEFTVHGEIPSVLMLQLGASATGKIEETEGLAAMWEALRCSMTKPANGAIGEDGEPKADDPAEFSRFYKRAVAKYADLQEIMQLTFKLFEAQSGRPTKGASASSPGQSSTSPSSSPSSTHPALAHLRPVSEVLAG